MDVLSLMILGLMFLSAQACFSSSPPATPTPTPSSPTPGDPPECKLQCEHGTCHYSQIGSSNIAKCICLPGFSGDLCQHQDRPDILANRAGMQPTDVGAIAGIIVAVVIVFFITLTLFFFLYRKRKQNDKPRLEDPYKYGQTDKSFPTKPTNDNSGVSKHMHPANLKPSHVSTNYTTHPSGQRNRAFDPQLPSNPSIKRADNPDFSRVHSTLSSSSRPPSNTGSVFHHNTSVQSNASHVPIAHHESTV